MLPKRNVNLSKFLKKRQNPLRIICISSYIPRKCGIATFTKDLTSAINIQNPYALAEIIAINNTGGNYTYPWEVKLRIDQNSPEDYINAANYINQSSADVVNLQHEFGLFGGVDGDYLLPMIDTLNKPLVTCFHTILPNPDEHKKYIIRRLIDKSVAIVAMSRKSKQELIKHYKCNKNKVVIIHHGVPDFSLEKSNPYKKKLNIKTKKMILMSGLINPDKGFEYVLYALPEILKHFPQVATYIIGEAHPLLKKRVKQTYQDKLIQTIKKNHLEKKVFFVNKFLKLKELCQYFLATDIYITPHLNSQQTSSGTLAKALGAGKVCISTPYIYAKEVLAKKTGILVPFKNYKLIAKAVINVLSSPCLFEQYRQNAYKIGKTMQWPKVAKDYLDLFRIIVKNI